ncbi:unnamed protein product [Amoebophrya sp. A120]|nr:unnamed protein product [Amoebophrya sp. A120]|eukprot:GSA120T00006880001.1
MFSTSFYALKHFYIYFFPFELLFGRSSYFGNNKVVRVLLLSGGFIAPDCNQNLLCRRGGYRPTKKAGAFSLELLTSIQTDFPISSLCVRRHRFDVDHRAQENSSVQ